MICIYSPDFARRLVCHQGLPLSLVTSHVLAMKSARGGCLKKTKSVAIIVSVLCSLNCHSLSTVEKGQ